MVFLSSKSCKIRKLVHRLRKLTVVYVLLNHHFKVGPVSLAFVIILYMSSQMEKVNKILIKKWRSLYCEVNGVGLNPL